MKTLAFFAALFALISSVDAQSTHTLTVQVKGFRSTKGQLLVDLVNKEEQFMNTAYKHYSLSKSELAQKSNQFTIEDLPPGEYGLTLVDDENMNEKMDMERTWATAYLIPIPSEGYGFPYLKKKLSRQPVYKDAVLQIQKDTNISIQMLYH